MHIERFKSNRMIYCTWDGFDFNLNDAKVKENIKELILQEHPDASNTSICTWASQLNIFSNLMEVGDTIVMPNKQSKSYNIGKIMGDYEYDPDAGNFKHGRKVDWTYVDVPRDIFTEYAIYIRRIQNSFSD